MGKYLFIVEVSVDPEKEEEWNLWYDKIHLPEIEDCPGFIKGSRYISESDDGNHYITVYEIVGPEALTTSQFNSRRGWDIYKDHVSATTRLYKLL